ncbi:MAG: NYN domain-containing protein [Deltaproteobacteria bacterium]|nr:NYN domain-containing protein [Deltaproteobacteria bacterium]
MAINIIIDGYNLIGARREAGLGPDIEDERERLVQRLIRYRKTKAARITLAFDGAGLGRLARTRETRDGVTVIFTGAGESADSLIKEYAGRFGSGLTVVTSDRDVASYAVKKGCVAVQSGEFGSLLDACEYAEIKGVEGEEDEAVKNKKGASRRLKKKERLKERRIKKL